MEISFWRNADRKDEQEKGCNKFLYGFISFQLIGKGSLQKLIAVFLLMINPPLPFLSASQVVAISFFHAFLN